MSAKDKGSIEDALELMCIVGFMTDAHYQRLAAELAKLREAYAAHERYSQALHTWEGEQQGDVFLPIMQAHRDAFIAEATQDMAEMAAKIDKAIGLVDGMLDDHAKNPGPRVPLAINTIAPPGSGGLRAWAEGLSDEPEAPAVQGAGFLLLPEVPTVDIIPAARTRVTTIEGPLGQEITLETLTTPDRFNDERSKNQLAVYMAHRLRGADERNINNLKRWHDGLRDAWEIENIGPARVRTTGEIA